MIHNYFLGISIHLSGVVLYLNRSVFYGYDFVEIRVIFGGFLSCWAVSVSCWAVYQQ